MATRALTVGDLLDYFRPDAPNDSPRWPPDALALALSILRDADAYSTVVSEWPPRRLSRALRARWAGDVRALGQEWRRAAQRSRRLPVQIESWWSVVRRARSTPLAKVRANRELCNTLLELVAAADEASHHAGIRTTARSEDLFGRRAFNRLVLNQTLGVSIDPSRAVVFPKVHTPQRGITSRSLTHHLSVYEPRDVVPRWFPFFPYGWGTSPSLNLLLLPWPETVVPTDFETTEGMLLNMPKEGHGPRSAYGFFTYKPSTPPVALGAVRKALRKAREMVGRVEAVVFPELALREGQCEGLSRALGVIVIGGEGSPAQARKAGANHAVVSMPLRDISPRLFVSFRQPKHHRWCMDAPQIQSYGLGAQLDPQRQWWEHIAIDRREVHFFEVTQWLNFCVLICEDLARQDPVSELVRAVGPNLVVALLMDGPQLEHRWAAKYATVLAEDPGCSVLTLTSLGMARLSRPPKVAESRAVALWKDPLSGGVPIEIPDGATGAVLCLTREQTRERTADGRDDDWGSDYIRLNGIHYVPKE